MERKYRALRTIGVIYKILGIIIGALTLLSILGFCATSLLGVGGAALSRDIPNILGGAAGGAVGVIIFSIFAVLYGGGLAVTMYAFGEGVDLFIALEENTRKTTALLEQQAAKAT